MNMVMMKMRRIPVWASGKAVITKASWYLMTLPGKRYWLPFTNHPGIIIAGTVVNLTKITSDFLWAPIPIGLSGVKRKQNCLIKPKYGKCRHLIRIAAVFYGLKYIIVTGWHLC